MVFPNTSAKLKKSTVGMHSMDHALHMCSPQFISQPCYLCLAQSDYHGFQEAIHLTMSVITLDMVN